MLITANVKHIVATAALLKLTISDVCGTGVGSFGRFGFVGCGGSSGGSV